MSFKNLPPLMVYSQLALRLRHRIEFAEYVATLDAPRSQIVETLCMQGRKAIETIAFMTLVATDHSLGVHSLPRDAKTQWNAETVFRNLKRRGLQILPSPSRVSKSDDPAYRLVISGIPEYRLGYDDLNRIYRAFHKGLHDPNPYSHPDEADFYTALVPSTRDGLSRVKNLVWSHFISIKGKGFMVRLKDSESALSVIPLDKLGDVTNPGSAGRILIANN